MAGLSAQNTVSNGLQSSEPIRIGIGTDGAGPFVGFLDEFRITRGHARYTANFPVPREDFDTLDPLFSQVALLLHFDGAPGGKTFTDDSGLANAITAHGSVFTSRDEIRSSNTSGHFSGLGGITGISIYNRGYGYDIPPALIVKTDKGSGATLVAKSDNIGQIESIEILEPFADSVGPMTVNVSSATGTGASISALPGSVFEEHASWKSLEGALGINSTLLDSYYYQQFSYTTYSPIPRRESDALVDEWVHPAGFVRFATLDISFSSSIGSPNGSLTDTFYLSHIRVLDGRTESYMVNFGNDYISDAPSIEPLPKLYSFWNNAIMVNPLSRLDWFKECDENYTFPISEWDNIICGDPLPGVVDPETLNRIRVSDNSIYMSHALDAQIDII